MLRKLLSMTAAAALVAGAGAATADEHPIKLGGLATLEGPFAVPGEDGIRGIRMALEKFGHEAGGREIELITASSDASPDSAVNAARRLVENDEVDVLVGPLSGSEGIAVKDYAKNHPDTTFVNGSSAAQRTTLDDPSENFFRFSTDGAQWQAGLGEYAYEEKGYEKVAIVAEDYSFPYSLVMGFMTDFCALGGQVVEKFYVPLGTRDYATTVASIPQDIDALYVALGGSDAINFLSQYQQMGSAKPMIAGSITVDQSVLGAKGQQRDYLAGTITAGPIADNWDDPKWVEFKETYAEMFDDGLPSPSLFAHAYYVNTLAVLTALDEVDGDLSNGQQAFREALQNLELETPTGTISVDENRNAVADIFITEVVKDGEGGLYNEVVKIVPEVNQTLGQPEEEFLANGFASRDNPSCP